MAHDSGAEATSVDVVAPPCQTITSVLTADLANSLVTDEDVAQRLLTERLTTPRLKRPADSRVRRVCLICSGDGEELGVVMVTP